ncbi:hypothetical protein EAG_10140 [Camponotus floridanus]|uniref:Uncharacterized protein n=1 Tax=Camponotus floridanus TaxID=104421 RepID=E2AS28_CAMFO|nr:hypothetical protein EAG_10140 [Camponotus floridanus]
MTEQKPEQVSHMLPFYLQFSCATRNICHFAPGRVIVGNEILIKLGLPRRRDAASRLIRRAERFTALQSTRCTSAQMCVTGFPRDVPANGGIGAGIDQLLRPRRFLVDSHDLRQELLALEKNPSRRI